MYADGAGASTREIQKHDLQNLETIVPGMRLKTREKETELELGFQDAASRY